MSPKGLIAATRVVFAKFGIHKKLVSDAGTNFISEQFKEFEDVYS